MGIELLREMFPPPSQNTMAVCNQNHHLILYSISSRPVPLLKIIDVAIQASDILDVTISFMFINFRFQIFLLVVLEMSASLKSYIVQIIYIALAWILYPLHFSLLPLI